MLLTLGALGACGGRNDYVFSEDSGQGQGGPVPGSGKPSGRTTGDGDGDYVGDGDYGDGDGDVSGGVGPSKGGTTTAGTTGDWYAGDGDYGYGTPGIGRPVGPGIYDPYWYGGSGGTPRPVVDEPLVGCEIVNSYSYGRDQCSNSYQCENGDLWASCWDAGDQIYCDCQADRGWGSFVLEPGTANSCQVIADYCAQGDVSGFGDAVCEPEWQDASSNYCSIEEQCLSQTTGPNGDPISWSQWKSTWCEKDGDSWMCNCNGGAANLSLNFKPSNGGLTACSEAGDLCEQAGDFSGSLKCTAEHQTASNDWCDVGLRCFQETEVDGVKVELNSWSSAYCDGYGQDQWECYCNGPGTRQSFVVDGMDPWDSCVQAGSICAEMIEAESAD